jgi:hypothetical protein
MFGLYGQSDYFCTRFKSKADDIYHLFIYYLPFERMGKGKGIKTDSFSEKVW